MRGRKPVPTALRKLHGNPRGHKLPVNEPLPQGDLDEPPDWLNDDQQEGWRYAIRHAPPGLLKRIDRGALQVWVVAESLHRKAASLQNGLGLVVKASAADNAPLVQSPYLAIINRQCLIMLKAASELGFSPVSRPRIGRELGEAVAPTVAKGPSSGNKVVSLENYLASHPAARTG